MSEAKRNCGRATDRGEEAWSEDVGLMNKKRIRGVDEQGERTNGREALMAKVDPPAQNSPSRPLQNSPTQLFSLDHGQRVLADFAAFAEAVS